MEVLMAREFVTDCEGPISKNDNAFELAGHFIPDGERIFSIISRYDDILSDIIKRQGYQAGDTLRLIVPFLKAFGATEEEIRKFSRNNLILLKGAKETLSRIRMMMEAFIVSTSYSPYIDALCDVLGFPRDRVYCTSLEIDRYFFKENEISWLKDRAAEIAEMEVPEIPENARSIDDLSPETRRTVERLDEIFFSIIPSMETGRILEEIKCTGGNEKARAIEATLSRTGLSLKDVMYVGDSITDCKAMSLVRENGGLSISFNGNSYAIGDAEVAVISENTGVIYLLARAFNAGGKKEVLSIVERWDEISSSPLGEEFGGSNIGEALAFRITDENRGQITKNSEEFRKKVRGEKIGSLG
jgi:energy-converting hydrogenase A subunit R